MDTHDGDEEGSPSGSDDEIDEVGKEPTEEAKKPAKKEEAKKSPVAEAPSPKGKGKKAPKPKPKATPAQMRKDHDLLLKAQWKEFIQPGAERIINRKDIIFDEQMQHGQVRKRKRARVELRKAELQKNNPVDLIKGLLFRPTLSMCLALQYSTLQSYWLPVPCEYSHRYTYSAFV